ncbi:MAG: pimeloyl-ACP methyl ester carboxylesterase [Oceanicoccus sp.]|jgi:pimeloyl-ACP methyl ester carboxylesterase
MDAVNLHFCHANGFPARSYDIMLNRLSEQFNVSFLEMHGHQSQYPVSNNWPHLVDELIDEIKKRHQQPIIAIGHSMGGVLIFLAAQKKPELFKHIILLDPPLLDRITSSIIGFAKHFKLIDKITPAGRTQGRLDVFDNHDHAFDYFSGKSLFKKADPRCVRDYILHGTEPVSDGLKLKYAVDTEVAIYRTLPSNILLNDSAIPVPTTLLYGQSSDVVRPALIRKLKNKHAINVMEVSGGHLFPLELPEQTADHIRAIIEAL